MSRLAKDAHASALGSDGVATVGGTQGSNNGFDTQFADAVLGLKQAIVHHPDDERPQAIRTVQQIYDSRIVDMGRIIKEASLTRTTVLSTVIIPRRMIPRQDAGARYGKVTWMKIFLDPALAGPYAVHGPHRIVSHRTVRYEMGFVEAAIGFTMSTKTLLKDEGVALAVAQGRQQVTNILDTYEFHVARAILEAHVDNIGKMLRSGLITQGTWKERARREASNFAFMQKVPEHAFERALDNFRRLFQMFDGTANVMLASDALISMYASVDPVHAEVFNTRTEGNLILRPGFETYTRVRDKALVPMPTFMQDEQEWLDLISNLYRIGDFGIADATTGPHENFNTKQDRSVQMWDEDLRRWQTISPYRMVDECGMFDRNGNMAALDSLKFAKDAPSVTQAQKEAYMMNYWDASTQTLRPIRLFGQMGGVQKSNPHKKLNAQRVSDVQNFVDSVYPQLRKVTMKTQAQIRDAFATIEGFVARIDQTSGDRTIAAEWFSKFAGKGPDGSTGFIELPGGADTQVFPPGFSSNGGLTTMANAYVLGTGAELFNTAAISEKFSKLPEALRIFNELAEFLNRSNGGSLAINARYAGKYLVNKSAGDTLFEQVFTPFHVPVFVAGNVAGRDSDAVIRGSHEISGENVAVLSGSDGMAQYITLPGQTNTEIDGRVDFVNRLRSRGVMLGLLSFAKPEQRVEAGRVLSQTLRGPTDAGQDYKALGSNDLAATKRIAHENVGWYPVESSAAVKNAVNAVFKTVNRRTDDLIREINANPAGGVGIKDNAGGDGGQYTLTPLMVPVSQIGKLYAGGVAPAGFVPASVRNFASPMSLDEGKAIRAGTHTDPMFAHAMQPTSATVDTARCVLHYAQALKPMGSSLQPLGEVAASANYHMGADMAMDAVFGTEPLGAHMDVDAADMVGARHDPVFDPEDGEIDSGAGRSLMDELSEPRLRYLFSEIHKRGWSRADMAIAVVFLLTPTDQQSWHAMMDNNLFFLPAFVINRPAIEFMASDIWMIQAGAETGELLIKEFQNTNQTDVFAQWVGWKTTVELGTKITSPENIARMPAAFIERYERGMGTKTLQRSTMEETMGENTLGLTGDISFAPIRRGETAEIGEFLSITGLEFIGQDTEPMYSSAALEVFKHGFSTGHMRLDEPFDELSIHVGPMQSITGIMGEASTRHYNHRTGEYDRYRTQKGHLPHDAISYEMHEAFSGNRSFGKNGMTSTNEVAFIA